MKLFAYVVLIVSIGSLAGCGLVDPFPSSGYSDYESSDGGFGFGCLEVENASVGHVLVAVILRPGSSSAVARREEVDLPPGGHVDLMDVAAGSYFVQAEFDDGIVAPVVADPRYFVVIDPAVEAEASFDHP